MRPYHAIVRSQKNRGFAAAALVCLLVSSAGSEPVSVRQSRGTVHGFLVIRDDAGKQIAVGDSREIGHGDRMTSQVVYRFNDGSIDEETAVFSQRGVFRLISDHHIQKGPSFPKPVDITILASGKVTTKSPGKSGQAESKTEHMDLPPDLANGLVLTYLVNLKPQSQATTLSMVAPGDKPRLIHISIKPEQEHAITIAGSRRQAIDYSLHIELGGVAGVIAPIIGKQPKDIHVWVLKDAVPVFLREDGEFYSGGPTWHVQQAEANFAEGK
jgi:hypothetical protein